MPHECCGQQSACTHPSKLRSPTSLDPTQHAYGLSTQGREETPGTTPPTPSGVSWAPAGLGESRLRDDVHVKEAYRQAAASDPGPSSRLAHEMEGAQDKLGPTGWPCVCPALPRAVAGLSGLGALPCHLKHQNTKTPTSNPSRQSSGPNSVLSGEERVLAPAAAGAECSGACRADGGFPRCHINDTPCHVTQGQCQLHCLPRGHELPAGLNATPAGLWRRWRKSPRPHQGQEGLWTQDKTECRPSLLFHASVMAAWSLHADDQGRGVGVSKVQTYSPNKPCQSWDHRRVA